MRCYGKFQNDRTCDMCSLLNEAEFLQCKQKHDEEIELKNKLENIKFKCPYRTTCYDEYDPFDACNINGDAYGRFAPDCKVTLECAKHIKNRTK